MARFIVSVGSFERSKFARRCKVLGQIRNEHRAKAEQFESMAEQADAQGATAHADAFRVAAMEHRNAHR